MSPFFRFFNSCIFLSIITPIEFPAVITLPIVEVPLIVKLTKSPFCNWRYFFVFLSITTPNELPIVDILTTG